MKPSPETPEQKIKCLEQKIKDLEDAHYVDMEMIKEVDRQCGTDFRKSVYPLCPQGSSTWQSKLSEKLRAQGYLQAVGISAFTTGVAPPKDVAPVKDMVIEIRRKLPQIGTRKLHFLLKGKLAERAIKLGRDGLFSYLREQHLLIKPRKSYTKTTHSKHCTRKHPNLYAGMQVSQPDQVFVSDITYVESREGVTTCL